MVNKNNIFERIISWEEGQLNADEEWDLFADLVDSGMIYNLQGTYQRTAIRLGFEI